MIDSIDPDEEGIGISLSIEHVKPAFIGEEVIFIGVIESFIEGRLICTWEAKVGDRIIAHGKTGQKIMLKSDIERLFNK